MSVICKTQSKSNIDNIGLLRKRMRKFNGMRSKNNYRNVFPKLGQ